MFKFFKRKHINIGEKEPHSLVYNQMDYMIKKTKGMYDGNNEYQIAIMLKMEYDATDEEIKEVLDTLFEKGDD